MVQMDEKPYAPDNFTSVGLLNKSVVFLPAFWFYIRQTADI